jgi:hypothetical protein
MGQADSRAFTSSLDSNLRIALQKVERAMLIIPNSFSVASMKSTATKKYSDSDHALPRAANNTLHHFYHFSDMTKLISFQRQADIDCQKLATRCKYRPILCSVSALQNMLENSA